MAEFAEELRELHAGPEMLVLPNAWDAASARAFEEVGFEAIATTSGGVSAAIGYEDHEKAPAEEMIAAAGRIVRAVDVPVSVDLEAGYGLSSEVIVERLIEIGAAGMNLEDTDHRGGGLVDAEKHAAWLAEVKAAARGRGVDLFLNARVDVFVQKVGSPEEQLAEGLRRARLYKEAGADCIYPIMLADPKMIGALVEAVGPINVNVRRGGPLGLTELRLLGVRRVTYASSLFRETMARVGLIAAEVWAEADA
jgi:2-methylisocitrate lyase-like PEP mutase family enzyme